MDKSLTSLTALTPANLPGEDTTTRALTYPYDRPPHGYIFHAGKSNPLPSSLLGLPLPLHDYVAVVSIGSNGAPEQLRRKYGDGDDVFIPVLAACVHNADFVFAANVSGYGSVSSTVTYSMGTIVHTHVTLLTKVEFERMNLTEGGYHLCKLALPHQTRNDVNSISVNNNNNNSCSSSSRDRNNMTCPFVEIVEFEDFAKVYDRDHIMMYVSMEGPLLLNLNKTTNKNKKNTSTSTSSVAAAAAAGAVPVAFDSFVAQHRMLDAADQRVVLEQVARMVQSPFESVEEWIRHLVAHPEYRREVKQQIENKGHVHDNKHFEIIEQLAID